MNVHYTARQAALTPEIKAYCEKRLARLKTLVDDILDVNVVLAVQKNRSKAEINVRAKGGGLVVAAETQDMMDSLNGAFDTLEDGKVRDGYRIDYLRDHIEQIQLAVTDGVGVMGYCPWSAIDLVSTHQGSSKRYGFVYVNRDEFDLLDLARYRKDSFHWYRKVINTNGADLS